MRKGVAVVMALGLLGCGGASDRVSAKVQLALEYTTLHQGLETPDGGTFDGCPAGVSVCTPYNLTGRIKRARAMWGQLGPDARSITLLGVPSNESEPADAGPLEFSLMAATTLPGAYDAPESGSTAKPITRMEFDYEYLDAVVELGAGGPMDGAWVIRTVFVTQASAPDVDGVMQRGDKLIRAWDETAFQWCGPSGCSAQRDAVGGPTQEAKLVGYVFPGQGDPDFIPFAVPLSNALSLTGDQLNTAGQTWALSFDMHHAVLLHAAPEGLADRAALLAAFELSYEPDQQHAGQQTEISASLSLDGP